MFLRRRIGERAHLIFNSRRGARPIAWSADGRRLLVADVVPGSGPHWHWRAVVVRLGAADPTAVPYTFDAIDDLSRNGREILGKSLDGEVVRVGLDGTARILARRGGRPDWVH